MVRAGGNDRIAGLLAPTDEHGELSGDLRPAMERLARLARRLAGAEVAIILLRRPDGELVGSSAIAQSDLAPLEELARRAIERREAQVGDGQPECFAIPVIEGGGEAIGAIAVRRSASAARDDVDREALEELTAIVADTLQRAEREDELRSLAEEQHALFTSIDEGLCIIDVLFDPNGSPCDYRFLEANPAFERHTGLRDAIGRTARELVPDLEAHWFEIYGRVASTGEPPRFVQHASAMDDRWFDVYAFRVGKPEQRHVALLFTDISERKRAEEDRARLAAIVEHSWDAIVRRSLDGAITDWNRGAELMYGYTAEEIVGRNVEAAIPPERADELADLQERLGRGEHIPMFETVRMRKDGTRFDVALTLTPIKDAEGNVTGVATLTQDISKRRELERLRRDLLAMVSHDLRTPLTAIRTSAQILQRRGEYRSEIVEILVSASERMDRLVGDLADMVRLDAGRLELRRTRCDLVEIVRAQARTVEGHARSGRVLVEPSPCALDGDWDADRVGQVVQNLLTNAVTHAPEEGTVTVRFACAPGEARISVADEGPGIAPEHLPHLFDRFYRGEATGAGGLGLGLYISRMLVEAHGGRIEVDSQLGHGTIFTVVLPRDA